MSDPLVSNLKNISPFEVFSAQSPKLEMPAAVAAVALWLAEGAVQYLGGKGFAEQ